MQADLLRNAQLPEFDIRSWRKLAENAIGRGVRQELSLHDLSNPDNATNESPSETLATESWSVMQRIDDPDIGRARQQIEDDLAHGATGLALVFEGAPNAFGYGLPATEECLTTLLEGLPLNDIALRIDVHPGSRKSMDWLVDNLRSRAVDPKSLNLSFGIDAAAIFAGTGRLPMSLEALEASQPQSLAHFFAMQVPGVLLEADGRVYHNAGASTVQELGAVASAAIHHLGIFQEARQPIAYAAPHIGFALSASHKQHGTIAKVQALRLIWARLLEQCDVAPVPAHIHLETSFRMLGTSSPQSNMLRNTMAASAAVLSGADSVSVLPHTIPYGLPESSARRCARDTQIILRDESVAGIDGSQIALGSAMKDLIETLANASWEEMRRLQTEGGLLFSLRNGHFQKRIAEAHQQRSTDRVKRNSLPSGEQPALTLPAEKRPLPTDGAVFCQRLAPISLDA